MNHTAASPAPGVETRSRTERIRARLRPGDEEGQSLVEFAVCLPVFLFLLTGIFAFGITIDNDLILTNATSVAALKLAIGRGQLLDPCATAVAAVYAAAPTLATANLNFTLNLNGNPHSGKTCSSATTTTGAPGDLVQGAAAQVIVTYTCSLAFYKANNFPGCLITANSTELVQ